MTNHSIEAIFHVTDTELILVLPDDEALKRTMNAKHPTFEGTIRIEIRYSRLLKRTDVGGL